MTSSVETPMEPVEPRTVIACMKFLQPEIDQRCQRQNRDQRINPIQYAAMPRQQVAAVLETGSALQLRLEQIPDNARRDQQGHHKDETGPAETAVQTA